MNKYKYLITYDLTPPGQRYREINAKILEIDEDAVKPLYTVWIIESALSAVEVIGKLTEIDGTDRVLVITVSFPAAQEGLSDKDVEILNRKLK